jgi:hypothetical protein
MSAALHRSRNAIAKLGPAFDPLYRYRIAKGGA